MPDFERPWALCGGDQETRGCFCSGVQSGGRGADISQKMTAEEVHSAVCRGSSWHCGTRASGLDGRGAARKSQRRSAPPPEAAESREDLRPEGRFQRADSCSGWATGDMVRGSGINGRWQR